MFFFSFELYFNFLFMFNSAGEDDWGEEAIQMFEDLVYVAKWKVIMAKTIGYDQTPAGPVPMFQLIDTNGTQVCLRWYTRPDFIGLHVEEFSNQCNYSVDSGISEYYSKSLTWESRISLDRQYRFRSYFADLSGTWSGSFKTNFGEIVRADAKKMGGKLETSPSNISGTDVLSLTKFGKVEPIIRLYLQYFFQIFWMGG